MRYRRDIIKRKALSVKCLKNKVKTDKVAHLKQVLRSHIRRVLRGYRVYTNKCRLYSITGLDSNSLVRHLYSTFEMTYGIPRGWINLKDVEIDHIIPLHTAKTMEDVKRLNHHTNLQLLLKEDNVSKGMRVNP